MFNRASLKLGLDKALLQKRSTTETTAVSIQPPATVDLTQTPPHPTYPTLIHHIAIYPVTCPTPHIN